MLVPQMTMAGQQGMGYMVRGGMPPGTQAANMYPQQPGQQFQRMQGRNRFHASGSKILWSMPRVSGQSKGATLYVQPFSH